jgi:RNA polymerase sigma factor (sigma-70 family)
MERVAAALEQLAPEEREAIVSRHLRGQPLEEIAAALQRTEAGVAGLLKRGLKKVRQMLQEEAPRVPTPGAT